MEDNKDQSTAGRQAQEAACLPRAQSDRGGPTHEAPVRAMLSSQKGKEAQGHQRLQGVQVSHRTGPSLQPALG